MQQCVAAAAAAATCLLTIITVLAVGKNTLYPQEGLDICYSGAASQPARGGRLTTSFVDKENHNLYYVIFFIILEKRKTKRERERPFVKA